VEKQQSLIKVYEERDAAMVKFAKQFLGQLLVSGCKIEFDRVAVSSSKSGFV
jgi:hypothetical protein